MKTIIEETITRIPTVDSVATIIFYNDGSCTIDDETYRALKKNKQMILAILKGVNDEYCE